MSALVLNDIGKRYSTHQVVDGLNLQVDSGEFVSLLGPSGCGKTTLLRIISGLTHCDTGQVLLDGKDITTLAPHKRGVGVVFQNYALFPHLSVYENIAFGLKAKKLDPGSIDTQVKQALLSVQMGHFGDRSILELSGGQQQRIAVARALATKPRLILLDEPLSALDRKLREAMQIELKHILRDAGMTAIFVTHDQEEALVMSDRIAVMNKGCIEQLDLPARVYSLPETQFVLNFVGLSAQWQGKIQSLGQTHMVVRAGETVLTCPSRPGLPVDADVLIGVRPERIQLRPTKTVALSTDSQAAQFASKQTHNHLSVTVRDMVFRGSNTICYLEANPVGAGPIVVELSANTSFTPGIGEGVEISWAVQDTLAFPAQPSTEG